MTTEAAAPIWDPGLEDAVLGSMLSNDDACRLASERLRIIDFYLDSNRTLFTMASVMHSAGAHVDAVTLSAQVPAQRERIWALASATIAATEAASYIELLQSLAAKRELHSAALKAAALVLRANGADLGKMRADFMAIIEKAQRVAAPKKVLNFSGPEFDSLPGERVVWVIRGLVALGLLTQIIAKIKCGKSMLAYLMARAMLFGEDFLDHAVEQRGVIYYTEERTGTLRSNMGDLGLLRSERLHIVQRQNTRHIDWQDMGEVLLSLCREHEASMVFVDTFAALAGLTGDAENSSGETLAAMRPLQIIAEAGVGLVATRHGRKSGGEIADAGRGSTAIDGEFDINLNLVRMAGHRRQLRGDGRFGDITPEDIVIELREDGYHLLDATRTLEATTCKQALLDVVPFGSANAIPLQDEVYPQMQELGHARSSAQRALGVLVGAGKIRQETRARGRSRPAFVWQPSTDDDLDQQLDV
jgi:hypothetical protein